MSQTKILYENYYGIYNQGSDFIAFSNTYNVLFSIFHKRALFAITAQYTI